jgi:hypothetical protein
VAATAVTKSAWLELSGYTRTCLEVSILSKGTANAVRRKKRVVPAARHRFRRGNHSTGKLETTVRQPRELQMNLQLAAASAVDSPALAPLPVCNRL